MAEIADSLITFSGYQWWVKEGFWGPGPNYFSRANVWLDEDSALHLVITRRDSFWYCAEVYSDMVGWGYGIYRFYITSRLDSLDSGAVLGLFTYDPEPPCQTYDCGEILDCCDLYHCHCREIDIEFCPGWGNTGHFSVQPNQTSGEHYAFDFSLVGHATTFQFEWLPGEVTFQGTHGHYSEMLFPIPAEPYSFAPGIICSDTVLDLSAHPDCVFPPGNERVHINLWLLNLDGTGGGDSITTGDTLEVIIDSFEFIPHDSVYVVTNPTYQDPGISISVGPNPFNSSCKILVTSSELIATSLEVFDINGRLVYHDEPIHGNGFRSFFQKLHGRDACPYKEGEGHGFPYDRMPGSPVFSWQPDNSLSSGIYFIKVNLGKISLIDKVIYLR